MTITVLNNQSLFDLAIRYCGSALVAFELASANGISITHQFTAGDDVEIPEALIRNKDVVNYFEAKNHQPATAWDDPLQADEWGTVSLLEGIDYWGIGEDFIVQ